MSYLRTKSHKLVTFGTSVALSFFFVALMVSATTYIDTDSVGIATATPGTALGVKGAGLFDGFVLADYILATSTGFSSGFGTTSPGDNFAVAGGALFDGHVTLSSIAATSTTATSTLDGAWSIASSTITIDRVTGAMAIGSTTIPDADVVAGTRATDPALSVFGLGSAFNATGTVYVGNNAGGGGGQIILKSTDGNNCASITFTSGTLDPGDTNSPGLTVKVVACPK